ncbi:hypothetical protein [Shewanella sp. T24-MNA-CIBAN-0130]|uniref:hypothetical protein n=1 Tax=Shewanella sp. T24-MNA-CIBAN-0130 TaxID=3140470 RepID=UPI003322D19C
MRAKEQARIFAELHNLPTYESNVPHIPRSTGIPCGHTLRYTRTGSCVHCAKTNRYTGDHLAPTGEILMHHRIDKNQRIKSAVECYKNNVVSIARCCHLFSLDTVTLGQALRGKGLTREPIEITDKSECSASSKPIDIKAKNVFTTAMRAFAPRREAVKNCGESTIC